MNSQATTYFQAPPLSTVKRFCQKYPDFPYGGVRDRIFNANKNGLAKSGAIVRNGRKVLINEAKWFAWIEAQNQS
ncbi:conserved hypothetical protein [Candidatus Methylobacter favarea]|uniref:Uncharacterized protein n=1 Tax=Candidatus Methylobacter favarea TaxID=2707345 RepID=A0A8S0WSE6_9GAMM|nr:hypothetical protein [Candidatus Methylobacter favarea]CAA9892671.1 conserved hypothetical protein [Candidatus Methylobacter favarea]